MTNTEKLRERMFAKHMSLAKLARETGRSTPSMRAKVNGTRDFTAKDIDNVCRVLDIPKSEIHVYFFADDVPKMETNA